MLIPLLSEFSDIQTAQARAYAKSLAEPPVVQPVAASRITVMGGAAAGLGVALGWARAGVSVTYLEEDESSLERAQFYLTRMLAGAKVPDTLSFSVDMVAASDCDALLDMTVAPMVEKLARLVQVAAALPEAALLITNLAGAHLAKVAETVLAPDRLLGAELYFPMAKGAVAELATHPGTSDKAVQRARGLVARLGKSPVMAGTWQFVSERLQMRMLEAADTLLMDGATPWDVDEALEAFGYQMGLYEAQDLIGTDVAYSIRKRTERQPARRYIPIADRAVEEGRLGKKASVGWYRYPGGEGKVIDPLVEDLCREEAYFAGVSPRDFSEDELREHLLLALINEAAWAVGQGCSAAEVDLIAVQALGFPADLGGVLYFADLLGAGSIVNALERLSQDDPVAWEIAPLLKASAATGIPLVDA